MSQDNAPEVSIPSFDVIALLEKIILGGIIFILALPLLGDYGNVLFPLGRDIIFKITVEFLVIVALILWSLKIASLREIPHRGKNLKTIFSPLTISLLLFWLILVASTIQSVQPEFSIWGNIYKNQGLMTWTHYLLFFFLLISFLKSKKQWKFLIYTAVLISSLVSLVAIWQVAGNDLVNRAASTLNNSNYLAAYLILLIPLTLSLFIKKPFDNARSKHSYLLGGALLLQSLALILTQTRGGYMGIASAIFVFSFLYLSTKKTYGSSPKFFSLREIPRRGTIFSFPSFAKASAGRQFSKRICLVLSASALVLLYFLVIFNPLGQSFQEKLPDFTDRFLNYQSIQSSSGPRLEAWQAGWKGMLARPLLGYGPENFFVPFDEFYSGSGDNQGSLAREGSLWETWFDKAHNFIFDIGATTGFLGLFAYIGIFASAIWVLLRKLKMYEVKPRTSILSIGLIAAFVGYLAQNLLGFDTFVTTMYLVFFLAFTNFTSNTHGQNPKISNFQFFPLRGISRRETIFNQSPNTKYEIRNTIALSSLVLALTILFILSFNLHLNILKANYNLNLAESLAQKGQINKAFATYEKGLEYNASPVNPNLRRRYAVIALAYYNAVEKHCLDAGTSGDGPSLVDQAKTVPANCQQLFADSEKYLRRALELQKENAAREWPRFTRNYIYAAQISHILGNYEESDKFFKKALMLSPNRASINAEWERLIEKRDKRLKSGENNTPGH